MPGFIVEESAPDYWLADGGNHITVSLELPVNSSALRPNRDQSWIVFDCYGNQSVWPSDMTKAHMISLCKEKIKRALSKELDNLMID